MIDEYKVGLGTNLQFLRRDALSLLTSCNFDGLFFLGLIIFKTFLETIKIKRFVIRYTLNFKFVIIKYLNIIITNNKIQIYNIRTIVYLI